MRRRITSALCGVLTLLGMVGFALPAAAFGIEVQREVLANGLTVQVVNRPTLPIVMVELGLGVGSVNDPEGQAGTASMTARLLTEGAAGKSANEIAEAVEFVGAKLGADAGRDFSQVYLSALKRDLKMGLNLLADVVIRPDFPNGEVERVKGEALGQIEVDLDNPGKVAAKAFDAELFGDHPYGRPPEGDADSIAAIDRNALVAFHRQYYRPQGAVLNFVGDITRMEAVKLAKKTFGGWRGAPPSHSIPPPPAPPSGTRLVRIDRPVTQANVVLGHMGPMRSHPDFYPVIVMNYILGGGATHSRLGDSIREDQGLAYAIQSGFRAMRHGGVFKVIFQTRNESAGKAVNSALDEIRRIRTEPVSDKELADARSHLVGRFPFRIDTNSKVAGLLSFIHMHDLGDSYFEDYMARVEAVTVDDVQRVANTYLHPDDMLWVVVSDPEEVLLESP
ncbi:MAG: M16 family metallopeptidase [Leptospirillia bacterium]